MTCPMELLGPGEIANHYGIRLETVSRWVKAGKLPPPDWQLKQGPVWSKETLRQWDDRND